MDKEIWNRLVEFTRKETDSPVGSVFSRKTRLVEDLGLIGDDADEFMGNFSNAFSVKSGDFEFDNYFPPEGFNLVGMIGALFSKGNDAKPITLGMLEHAIELGLWNSDQIESQSHGSLE